MNEIEIWAKVGQELLDAVGLGDYKSTGKDITYVSFRAAQFANHPDHTREQSEQYKEMFGAFFSWLQDEEEKK